MTLLRSQTYSAIGLRLFLSYIIVFQLIFLLLLMASCPQSLSVHQKLLSYDFLVTLGTGLTAFNSKDWFMDVTHGTNRQQRDLFMLAIRTPTGETFPGNITIIPSQKRWIFHCIYRYAFIHLCGTDTCSHNRLVLCDKDESEYGPFENQILTNKTIKDSRLMLCKLHAQTHPFKKEVYHLLPRKSPKRHSPNL